MIFNSAGSFSCFTPRFPFLYILYHLRLHAHHTQPRVHIIADREKDKRAGDFIRRPRRLVPLALSFAAILRLPKRWYLCRPVELPSPAGILTRSRASDPWSRFGPERFPGQSLVTHGPFAHESECAHAGA